MTAPETIQMPALGQQGETCAECGSELATDQRYCLNCGRRRAGPRIASVPDYLLATAGGGAGGSGGGPAQQAAPPPAPRPQLSPLLTASALAALGVFLLIGVLIGKGDSPEQTAAAPAVVTVGEPATGSTEDAGSQTASTAPGKKGGKKAKAGGGEVKGPQASSLTSGDAGASGETVVASEEALEELQNTTGAAYEDARKKLPDKIATPGALPEQDPGGKAGAGSDAAVIK